MKVLNVIFIAVLVFVGCKQPNNQINEVISKPENVEETVIVKSDTSNMVYFKGGTILIGSNNGDLNEKPVFEKQIAPFYLDKNLVTVSEFRTFINTTNYKTDADKFGDSGVFLFESNTWTLLKGANWEYPLGLDKPKAIDNHPVTHISWNDAKAYASWIGKRLPTEFEWEFAAKNGVNNAPKYAWGTNVIVEGKYMANVWQGDDVFKNEVLDGYLYTSPVGVFGETPAGLNDMGGNVWQWCENYFKPYPYNENEAPENPTIKTLRGGSFMFDQAKDESFTTTFRSKNSIETSLFNTGFRCAK
jgi:sulfatase modifying factor 1